MLAAVIALHPIHHHHRHHHRTIHRHVYPAWWRREASCIRWRESRDEWHINIGNGYYGAYQFLLSTWRSVGGRGLPSDATPREQTYRAHRVWSRDGGSWREWGTAGGCGLR